MRVSALHPLMGIVHSASLKLILLHVALVSSLLRTIVSSRSLATARTDVAVPVRSMYRYISAIWSGVNARSRCSKFAKLADLIRPEGLQPCDHAQWPSERPVAGSHTNGRRLQPRPGPLSRQSALAGPHE